MDNWKNGWGNYTGRVNQSGKDVIFSFLGWHKERRSGKEGENECRYKLADVPGFKWGLLEDKKDQEQIETTLHLTFPL